MPTLAKRLMMTRRRNMMTILMIDDDNDDDNDDDDDGTQDYGHGSDSDNMIAAVVRPRW